MSIFDSEKHMAYTAFMGWVTYIETGEFAGMDRSTILKLAATDKDMQRVAQRLPNLTIEQQHLVDKIRDLATKVLNNGQLD